MILTAGVFIGAVSAGEAQQIEAQNKRVANMEDARRQALLRPDAVVKELNIKPGMTIVDIGAGSGIFTFRMAEALEGTGEVYATEINDALVKRLAKESEARGYENVHSVLVSPEGLDEFYKQHKFDLVLLSGVYYSIYDPFTFLRELQPNVKDNGRVVILQPVNDEFFIPQSITVPDVNVILEVLRKEGESFPIFKRLKPRTREYIGNWNYNVPPEDFLVALSDDLNDMLSDTTLFLELVKYYAEQNKNNIQAAIIAMQRENSGLVNWLSLRLDENGVFGNDYEALTEIDQMRLNKLNGIIIRGIFQLRPALGPVQHSYMAEINSIKRTMEKAGYVFVDRNPVLERYFFLEFKKDPSRSQKELRDSSKGYIKVF